MQLVSIEFLIFFPLAVLLYFLLPAKVRLFWLLTASYLCYISFHAGFAVLLFISTCITWFFGLLLGKMKRHRKAVLMAAVIIELLFLFYFKYFNFMVRIVNDTAVRFHTGSAGDNAVLAEKNILLPIGISFYTLQLIGYLIDVYRNKVPEERSFIRYALFASFFPVLQSGPIERAGNLLPQIRNMETISRRDLFDIKRIRDGGILMIWGMFLKLVLADRIAILVNSVYSQYYMCGSVMLLLGAVGYTLQIYCDFAGYSLIAFGTAKIMGFRITENFAAPYAAVSITDFWRRWHVSLSTWLRDYIYIPLGGNRKGRFRKCLNILITFLVSGLWHGADWSFIFWGLLHGLYLVAENIFRPLIRRMNRTFHIPTASSGYLICRRAYTFVLVGFAWIFFRADSMHQAVRYISRMFSQPDWWILNTDQVFQYGLSAQEMWIAGAALLLLLFMDAVRVRKGMMPDAWLDSQWVVFRVLFVGFLAVSTIVFGIYGPGFHSGDFIYMKF